ncbi:MAG: type IV secretory system conjugative DNA transfer family protein, partial [Acidimicrobiales bacterium]
MIGLLPAEVAAAVGLVVVSAITGALGRPGGGRTGVPPGHRPPIREWRGGQPARRSGGWPGGRPAAGRGAASATWAGRSAVRPLRVAGLEPGRLALGTAAGPRWRAGGTALAAEHAQSVAVVGPTQSGKTTALAVPAILGWDGPVVAASVKTDLVRDTLEWRRRCGRVWCFDPGRATALPASRWSPLLRAGTWPGARRVAADLTEVAHGTSTTSDGEFWYASAAKLLAPLLFAAAAAGCAMDDVVRWVDTQEVGEVVDILQATGVPEALQAARATWQRDERQRSAVYATAETVLEPYADELAGAGGVGGGGIGASSVGGGIGGPGRSPDDTPPQGMPAVRFGGDDVDPDALLLGSHTLYLCSPAHEQRRLRGLFVALVKQVLDA